MRLILDTQYYVGILKCATLTHPPIESFELFSRDFHAFHKQGFSWHPNRIKFETCDENCWLRVFNALRVEVEPDSERAILVPFEIPPAGTLNISDQFEVFRVTLSPGQYQLLFEYRQLTVREIQEVEKYNTEFSYYLPELEEKEAVTAPVGLCTLTFIKTQQKIEPQLLKFFPWRDTSDSSVIEKIESGEIGPEAYAPETIIMYDEPFVEE